MNILAAGGVTLQGRLHDIALMHYLLDPEKSHKIEVLAQSVILGVSIEESLRERCSCPFYRLHCSMTFRPTKSSQDGAKKQPDSSPRSRKKSADGLAKARPSPTSMTRWKSLF